MKKSLLVLTAALSFGMAAAQTAPATNVAQVPTLTDVPAGHWAKDAIDRAVAAGVILGYPDGTFRGTQNLTRYEAAVIIARLLDRIASGQITTTTTNNTTVPGATPSLDPAALASLQNAVQELAADLAALGVRVSDLEQNAVSRDDFARLEARVEGLNTTNGDPAAVAALTSQLSDLSSRVDDLSSNYDTLRADVDDNASSIAALNDLTVLLNNDILSLQDRVSTIEGADYVTRSDFNTRVNGLDNRVTGIDTRVTTLENAPKFSVNGDIEVAYSGVSLNGGSNAGDFDIDRLVRGTFIGDYFSTGSYCVYGTSTTTTAAAHEQGAQGILCTDTTNTYSSYSTDLVFSVKNLPIGTTGIKINNAQATVTAENSNGSAINNASNTNDGNFIGNTLVAFKSAQIDGTQANGGTSFKIRFDNGYNSNSNFKFNDYLFANDNDADYVTYRKGIVATLDGTKGAPALAPKLTVVIGSTLPDYATFTNTFNPATGANPGVYTESSAQALSGTYFGVRGSANLFGLGETGLSYAQGNVNPAPGINLVRRDAVSIDTNLKFGAATVQGAYVASYATGVPNLNPGNAQTAAFAKFGVVFNGITVGANYRYIDAAYESGIAGMSTNDSAYYYGVGGFQSSAPFGPNENGGGANVAFSIGPVALSAYGNSFVAIDPTQSYAAGRRQTALGVAAGTSALFGFSLQGFFNQALQDGTRVSQLVYNNNIWGEYDYYNPGTDTIVNGSNFGVVLKHDGSSAGALIPNLNILARYAMLYDDNTAVSAYNYRDIVASAQYNGNFGGFIVKPYARFHNFYNVNGGVGYNAYNSTATAGQGSSATLNYGSAGTEGQSYTTYKYGVQLATPQIDFVPGAPSLFANFANRSTTYANNPNNPQTELFGNAGVTINQFFALGNKLSIGASYYQGFNLSTSGAAIATGAGFNPYSVTADRIFKSPGSSSAPQWSLAQGTGSGTVRGVFGQFEGYGVKAAYGVFGYNNLTNGANTSSVAQAFKVSTSLKF